MSKSSSSQSSNILTSIKVSNSIERLNQRKKEKRSLFKLIRLSKKPTEENGWSVME